jgi:hypothetical protein
VVEGADPLGALEDTPQLAPAQDIGEVDDRTLSGGDGMPYSSSRSSG